MRHRLSALALCAFFIVVGGMLAAQELVITREGSKEYHRPACEVVQGRSDILAMQRGQAEARGFKPHKECDPAYVAPGPKAVTVTVTVDDAARYYHRDRCNKIGKSPRQVTLDEAARKHWPCPTCKPPIRPRRKPSG